MAETESFNGRFSVELLERMRNAIWHIGRGLTLTDVIEKAAWEAVKELERQHNGGKPFPQRATELPKSPRKKKRGKASEED